MSLPLPEPDIAVNNVSRLWDEPNDEQGLSPTQLKAVFDKFANDWMDFYKNTLAPAGCSMEDLETAILGNIPDGTLTGEKLQADTLTEALMAAEMKKQAGGVAKYDDLAVGWLAITGACEYVNSKRFTIAGDWTGVLNKGNRFRCTQSRAYTNDPSIGSDIVINMPDTSGFNAGNKVIVSSSAGSETATITEVVENTSIKVDALTLNHTTVSPLVTCVKYMFLTTDPTYDEGAGLTTVKVNGGTDYTLGTGAISNPLFSKLENPQGWPGYFQWNPEITTLAGLSMTVSNIKYTYAKFWPESRNMIRYRMIAELTLGGTANAFLFFTPPVTCVYVDPDYLFTHFGEAMEMNDTNQINRIYPQNGGARFCIHRSTNFSTGNRKISAQGYYEY